MSLQADTTGYVLPFRLLVIKIAIMSEIYYFSLLFHPFLSSKFCILLLMDVEPPLPLCLVAVMLTKWRHTPAVP